MNFDKKQIQLNSFEFLKTKYSILLYIAGVSIAQLICIAVCIGIAFLLGLIPLVGKILSIVGTISSMFISIAFTLVNVKVIMDYSQKGTISISSLWEFLKFRFDTIVSIFKKILPTIILSSIGIICITYGISLSIISIFTGGGGLATLLLILGPICFIAAIVLFIKLFYSKYFFVIFLAMDDDTKSLSNDKCFEIAELLSQRIKGNFLSFHTIFLIPIGIYILASLILGIIPLIKLIAPFILSVVFGTFVFLSFYQLYLSFKQK